MFTVAAPVCRTVDSAKADRIDRVPIQIFHGIKEPLLLVHNSRYMYDALKKSDGNPKYTEYKGVKHNNWDKACARENLRNGYLPGREKINRLSDNIMVGAVFCW